MNTLFSYEYRDAGNYHVDRDIVLAGEVSADAIKACLESGLCDGGGFIPSQVGLDNLQSELAAHGDGDLHDDDHVWHSILKIEPTPDAPTGDLTAATLLEAFTAAKDNWDIMSVSQALGLC
jgi:hypothetical protein